MKKNQIIEAYKRYAPVYDFIFGGVLSPGRRAAIEILNESGAEKILEVGVGTGLSLPFYCADMHIHGIDLSPDMLKKASRRVEREGLDNVTLSLMDAQNLEFNANTFDGIAMIHTLSAVPDPERVLEEVLRVAKPGATLVICNHFRSNHPLLAGLEKSLAPAAGWIGFEPAHPLPDSNRFRALKILSSRRINLGGYWKLLHCRVEKPTLH